MASDLAVQTQTHRPLTQTLDKAFVYKRQECHLFNHTNLLIREGGAHFWVSCYGLRARRSDFVYHASQYSLLNAPASEHYEHTKLCDYINIVLIAL